MSVGALVLVAHRRFFAHCRCFSLASSLTVVTRSLFARCLSLLAVGLCLLSFVCSLSLSLLAVVVFACCCCLRSMSIVLRSMSFVSSHAVVRSWLFVPCLGTLSFVLAHCPLSWLAVLCLGSLSFLLACCPFSWLAVLRFFAQWRCSLLNVVGRWTKSNR